MGGGIRHRNSHSECLYIDSAPESKSQPGTVANFLGQLCSVSAPSTLSRKTKVDLATYSCDMDGEIQSAASSCWTS